MTVTMRVTKFVRTAPVGPLRGGGTSLLNDAGRAAHMGGFFHLKFHAYG